MDGLPEDQRDDDDDSQSSGGPSTPEPENNPQRHGEHGGGGGGANAYPPELPAAPRPPLPHDQGAHHAPLLLRHASISSLDESSQKYKSSVSTFSDGGL
jgi:hypothetical protein